MRCRCCSIFRQFGKPVCRNENAHFIKVRGDGPGSRNDASCHFLTVGNRCGNSARRGLKGLYTASFALRPVPRSQLNQILATQRSRWNRVFNETYSLLSGYLSLRSTREIPKMSNQNDQNKPGQQNQTPGQKPGQQQGGGQKPGQQQQDPNRQGQNPNQGR
jgi:hypothetical protein